MKKQRWKENSLWGWRGLKGLIWIGLDSLLYYCLWIWYVVPLFALPVIPWLGWLGFEFVRERMTERGFTGKLEKGGMIGFWTGIISYGFLFLVVWLCSFAITPESIPRFQFPEISINFSSSSPPDSL